MHKFKLIKNKNGFRVQFAYRSEAIFWTENYTKRASALKALNTLREKALGAELEEVDETLVKAPAKKAAPKVAKKVAKKASK